ncbi:UPF0573 protein C2orf70 [Amphibalanus amphitrite]|uniref:Ciliary microtubule inner protein 2C n=1 Tax=Amphibalanus amphitrite TaxID=1232801 RepID=A0A6A4W0H6_AMPAM|nr:UPF0573 protein C2orf70 [Amphibalanus amphitrite]
MSRPCCAPGDVMTVHHPQFPPTRHIPGYTGHRPTTHFQGYTMTIGNKTGAYMAKARDALLRSSKDPDAWPNPWDHPKRKHLQPKIPGVGKPLDRMHEVKNFYDLAQQHRIHYKDITRNKPKLDYFTIPMPAAEFYSALPTACPPKELHQIVTADLKEGRRIAELPHAMAGHASVRSEYFQNLHPRWSPTLNRPFQEVWRSPHCDRQAASTRPWVLELATPTPLDVRHFDTSECPERCGLA